MKKKYYLPAFLFMGTMLSFLSCSDDDKNDGGDEPKSEEIKTATIDATAYDKWVYFSFENGSSVTHEIEPFAGTYNGDVDIVVAGQNYGKAEGLDLDITRVNKDSVDIVLKNFVFGNYDMGDIAAGAVVSVDSTGWRLTVAETTVSNMKVSCEGTIAGKNATLDMKIQPDGMPMQISATYQGELTASTNVDETTFDWDIAFHSYDKKTNGGSVLETTETELANVTTIPSGDYITDIESDSLLYDMSGMMTNSIGYASGHLNTELGKSATRNLNQMPPVYGMSGLVYLVKTKSGEYAKMKVTSYSNENGTNGHFTFDYVYPVE